MNRPALALLLAASLGLAAPAVPAQPAEPLGQAADEAARAAELLRQATGQLDQALTKEDQVASLTLGCDVVVHSVPLFRQAAPDGPARRAGYLVIPASLQGWTYMPVQI